MFMHPYIRRELSRERQRDMLTHAQRLHTTRRLHTARRRLHAESVTTRHREQPWQRLRHALRAAAGLRAAPQT
jgi:hypothetical protein